MNQKTESLFANVPMQFIGPVSITGPEMHEEVLVPMATYESPLWPSTNRGARVTHKAGGIHAVVIDDRMTRSVLLESKNAAESLWVTQELFSAHGRGATGCQRDQSLRQAHRRSPSNRGQFIVSPFRIQNG